MVRSFDEQLPFEIPQDEDIEAHEPVLDVLDTVEKLRIMTDDPRAGFLPATHREKNQAVAILDYLNNPRYPGGVHDYLAEIYDHNKKLDAPSVVATLAVRSVLYEFSDYAISGRRDAQELSKLKTCIDDTPNPNLNMQAVIDAHEEAQLIPALLFRFMDVRDLTRGAFKGLHDPLLTQEYRRQLGAGKNKIVTDSYTAEELGEYMTRYIYYQLQDVSVGQVRPMVAEAMQDQRRRFVFWSKVLSSRLYEYSRYAEGARGLLKI